jgi:hypothetical protein
VAGIVVVAALAMPLASRPAASRVRGRRRIGGLRWVNPDYGVVAGCRLGQKSW